MSKIRTTDQPAPEHTQATEFRKKIESNAKAAQVHGEALRHSYESVLPGEDSGQADDAKGTEVGDPSQAPTADKDRS